MNQIIADIRYLNRNEIDNDKWDHCIKSASNGLVYARSFYLDTMAKNWSALVWNDYEIIMPLTWNRKFGISYLYQPAFTAQLGIFYNVLRDQNILLKFVDAAKSFFRFCEIHLNFGNHLPFCEMRPNYILNLNHPYQEIRNKYKKRLLENLKEASMFDLKIIQTDDYQNTIRLFKNEYGGRFKRIRNHDYSRFDNLCALMANQKMMFVKQVNTDNGDLLNSSIFFSDNRRIYNVMSVTNKAGRQKRAHFYLLDQLIQENAGNKLTLDFEGSKVAGIAEFYRKFGTEDQPYPFLYFNNLPIPIRYFK